MVKNFPANAEEAGDVDSVPGLGRSPWRKKWQPIPVSLPEKSLEQRGLKGPLRVSGVAKSQTRHFSRDSTHHYLSLLLPCLFILKKPWKSHSVLKLLPWVFGNVSPAILLPGENHTRVGALTKPWCPAPSASSGQPSKFHYALTSVLSLKSCPECPLKL